MPSTTWRLSCCALARRAIIAGRSVIHDARRAASTARKLLRHGQVEVWDGASHALTGEYPDRIAERAVRFWDDTDGC